MTGLGPLGARLGACLVASLLLLGSGAAAVGADPATGTDPGAAVPAPPPLPEALTHEAARDLLARLSDAEVRALLLAQLDRLVVAAAAGEPEAGVLRDAGAAMAALRDSWRRRLAAAPALPSVGPFLVDRLVGERSAAVFPLILLALALCFAVGLGAERLFRRLTADIRRQATAAVPGGSAGVRLGYPLLGLGLDLLGLAVFALATLGAFLVAYQGHEPVRLTLLTYLGAVVAARAVVLASRCLLAPDAPALRLAPLGDDAARGLHRWVVRLAVLWAALFPTVNLLRTLGLDPDLAHLLGTLAAAAFVATLIALTVRGRHPVAELIRGGGATRAVVGHSASGRGRGGAAAALRDLCARTWHVFAIAYLLLLWALAEVTQVFGLERARGAGLVSLLLVVAVPLADAALGRGLAAYAASRRRQGREGGGGGGEDAFARVARRGLRLLLYLVAALVFADLWGVDPFTLAEGGLGARAVAAVRDVGLVLLPAYVLWELIRAAIDRRLAREEAATAAAAAAGPAGGGETGGEGGGAGASRLRTLLPLLRSFLLIALLVLATMTALAALGVNIAPLLAGAGVVGLAIGFGAQTLVKDIVSGAFFLLDDAFRLGEYIEVGEVKGTVEKISIRSMRLRHHRGALNTVPYGEITRLTNHSRDWVIEKLEFLVPHDTDLAKVKRIFKRIGRELQDDPAMGPNLLEPLKSQGVLRVEDSGLAIRAKFMAKPGEQFLIRREVYQRVQQAFEENGIPFARRQVAVYVPPAAAGGAPNAEAVAGAVASAAAAEPARA